MLSNDTASEVLDSEIVLARFAWLAQTSTVAVGVAAGVIVVSLIQFCVFYLLAPRTFIDGSPAPLVFVNRATHEEYDLRTTDLVVSLVVLVPSWMLLVACAVLIARHIARDQLATFFMFEVLFLLFGIIRFIFRCCYC